MNTNAKHNKCKQNNNHVEPECLMSISQLAKVSGMTVQNIRHHLPRWISKGLVCVKVEGGNDKYTASSWNKIINEAIEQDKPL